MSRIAKNRNKASRDMNPLKQRKDSKGVTPTDETNVTRR